MTNASSSARGRRVKFTPQAIEKIKELVAEGLSRDEIANRLGVTVGSLQVTCSRLELFRPTAQGGQTADVKSRSWAIEIMMRCHGIEQPSDIPLSLAAIEVLALGATSRDLGIAELMGQSLVAAINKDTPGPKTFDP